MAFYAARVDEFGIEIEVPKSYRGYDTSCFLSPCDTNDQESTISRHASSLDGIYTRYINPAISIEKAGTSIESLSDRVPSVIPPLDLNSSGDTMPSTDSRPDVSYTIQKICQASRISQPDAFSNWLSGKKKLKKYENAKQKEMEKQRQIQLEEKKQLAEKEYQLWLLKKSQPKAKPAPQTQTDMQGYEEVCQTNDDSESNRRAWEQNKLEELRRKRQQVLEAKKRQKLLEEERKRQASKAWKNWLAEAPFKPKPVPLNKGFLTLKGTISETFINPIPWREPFDVDGIEKK